MERTVVDCDNCGKQNMPDAQKLYIVIGRSFDGVEKTDDQKRVDLCPACCGKALQAFLRKRDFDYTAAAEWYRAHTGARK